MTIVETSTSLAANFWFRLHLIWIGMVEQLDPDVWPLCQTGLEFGVIFGLAAAKTTTIICTLTAHLILDTVEEHSG